MANKVKTSFSLSLEARNLIRIIAERYCISKTAVIELAVREYAKKENIKELENDRIFTD